MEKRKEREMKESGGNVLRERLGSGQRERLERESHRSMHGWGYLEHEQDTTRESLPNMAVHSAWFLHNLCTPVMHIISKYMSLINTSSVSVINAPCPLLQLWMNISKLFDSVTNHQSVINHPIVDALQS